MIWVSAICLDLHDHRLRLVTEYVDFIVEEDERQ